jgi:plasmid stability protein
MQYTLRGIPDEIDAALRERARAAGKSLNEVAIEALAEGAGVTSAPRQRRNLDDIAGTWKPDKAFDEAIADQDQIDEDLWK